MFDLVEPYSGHFYDAQYFEYDENNDTYKTPIFIKLKGHASIGVSSGIKESIQVQDLNGRWVAKDVLKVNTVDNKPYKIKDKIRMVYEHKDYLIMRLSDDINHPNALGNIMFTNANVPKVLYLGDL